MWKVIQMVIVLCVVDECGIGFVEWLCKVCIFGNVLEV